MGLRASAVAVFKCRLDRLHLRSQSSDLGLLSPDLHLLRFDLPLLLVDKRLLFFGGFDEQGCEASIVNGPGVYTILLVGHHLGDDRADFFSDHADLMLAVGL